ncbi:sugar phosphate nucleotidyltransferase [Thiorhodovibrio frisius]|uniref:Nucleoside-diphosphate-sugar pyrophosphorylase family protein n=1 Tax=Thiorhodovibrio frisius TaxID=631362 RepID=H8YVV6_9GAMM|nr:sugar phosphate nucleotidyltransferase [Thiorhodovibrio frisius]EIC23747.1 Nucleoside-diphosphate-sugar pyrophosphorylase family protein [Thiorhodovibrio frisius]WPL20156.1 Glucose-1-phosphate cytidylyltransferase [Thiorhodovibrio frisius]
MPQALILVGGQGTRLGPLTAALPKPMLNIGGRPFIERLIEEVARHGIDDIILLCGYLAERIAKAFDGTRIRGAHISCVTEPAPLGTGGALRQAAERLDDRFLLLKIKGARINFQCQAVKRIKMDMSGIDAECERILPAWPSESNPA